MAVTNIYADLTHVQALINVTGGTVLTIGAGTVPTTSQVEGWLDQIAAEVDSVLKAQGYGTVPASGTNDVLMIRRFVAQKVACMVYHAGFMFDTLPDKVGDWCEEYDQFLDRLIDKKISLIDQAAVRGKTGVIVPYRWRED